MTRMTPAGPVKFRRVAGRQGLHPQPGRSILIKLMDPGQAPQTSNNLITALSVLNNQPVDAVRRMMHQLSPVAGDELAASGTSASSRVSHTSLPEQRRHRPLLDTNASTATQTCCLVRQSVYRSSATLRPADSLRPGVDPAERFRDDWFMRPSLTAFSLGPPLPAWTSWHHRRAVDAPWTHRLL